MYLRQPEQRLVLTEDQNWKKYSHEQLYKSVHDKNNPGQVGQLGAEWEKFRTELTEAAREINAGVAATESGWTGLVADTARDGMRKLAEWVTETAESVCKMADQVQEQGRIMCDARSAMPEPKEFDYAKATKAFSGDTLTSLLNSADNAGNDREEAKSGKEQAVAVMKLMEEESQRLDRTTPSFSAPYNPTTGGYEGADERKSGDDSTSVAATGVSDRTASAGDRTFAAGVNDGKASFGPGFGPDGGLQRTSGGFPQMKGSLGGGFGGGFPGDRSSFGASPTPPQMAPGGRLVESRVGPTGQQAQQRGFGPMTAGAGHPGAGAPPMGPQGGGRSPDDLERKNKYALSEDIIEQPGADLPPAVIGDFQPPRRPVGLEVEA